MWFPTLSSNLTSVERNTRNGLVAVAVDEDKGSQHAIKWAVDHLIPRGGSVILIHVVPKSPSSSSTRNEYDLNSLVGGGIRQTKVLEFPIKRMFLPFHIFCTRKEIHFYDVVLEDSDVARAIIEYVSYAAIDTLVLGTSSSSSHGFIRRFKTADDNIPNNISKGIPDFCNLYVVSKSNKISSMKNGCGRAPFVSPLLAQIPQLKAGMVNDNNILSSLEQSRTYAGASSGGDHPRQVHNPNLFSWLPLTMAVCLCCVLMKQNQGRLIRC